VLKEPPWYETEKQRDGAKWIWRIYREGYFRVQGTAGNAARTDQDIEVTKPNLMGRYDDWRVHRCPTVYVRRAVGRKGSACGEAFSRRWNRYRFSGTVPQRINPKTI
jgi:hypothetical protein